MLIRNKLIIYTFSSIFITLVIVGVSIDRVVTDLYSNNAITELEHSYSNFLHELDAIEHDVLNQTLHIANDNSVIALSNLVNRYQNKVNYQPLIFNNDKQKAAIFLLKQIALTKAEQAMIYSKKGDLIAYAIHNNKISQSGFISYKNGAPVNIILSNESSKWVKSKLPDSINLQITPLKNEISFLTYSGKVHYFSKKDKFTVENSRVISRNLANGKTSLLGVVKVNKSLNDVFFKDASDDGHTKISLLLHSGHLINPRANLLPIIELEQNSQLHRSTSSVVKLKTKNNYFIQSYIWPTAEGNNYLLTTSSRTELLTALNKTRTVLFISFSFTALLAIIFGIYWLNKLISSPLKALTEKASTNGSDTLPKFPISKSNDEISLLGKVLNDMVDAIRKRENQLIENETQLRHTQMLAKIGGWKVDYATNEMQFTDEIFNILELDKAQNIASHELIQNAVHPDDYIKVEETYNESMAYHIPYNIIHHLLIKDGSIKTVHVYSETQFDKKGNPLKTIGAMQDITEQTEKDEQLRHSQKMDSIGKLTGGIAHDFNNMLGVIIGFSGLLKEKLVSSEKQDKFLDEIISAANRASKLTSKLLSFSRKDSVSACENNLNQILNDEQIMLEKTLTVRIQLKLKLSDNLWSIWLDKDELEDAVVNMSINAMHAMPSGGELTLETKNKTLSDSDVANMDISAGDYVLLSITDSGIGMNQETKQKIFEPFFTTKEDKGTGLGMSQVYGFVKRSHGTITITSELNHGAQIKLYFPRYMEKEHASKISNDEDFNIDLTGSSTILIVDDEHGLRELTNEILTSNGYRVLTAESGKQALKILKTEPVDLVFSDVIMPGMDGYQLATLIQKHYPDIKIQMTSGFSDIKNPEILESELFKKLLKKPFDSTSLLIKIKECLTEAM